MEHPETTIASNSNGLHSGPVLFCDYCRKRLGGVRRQLKDSSYARYRNQVERHIIPFFGSLHAATFTDMEATRFLFHLRESRRLLEKTQKDVLIVLTSILKYAGQFAPEYLQIRPEYPRVL